MQHYKALVRVPLLCKQHALDCTAAKCCGHVHVHACARAADHMMQGAAAIAVTIALTMADVAAAAAAACGAHHVLRLTLVPT